MGAIRKVQPLNPTAVAVGDTAVKILSDRYTRIGCTFINVSENFITLRLDGTATIDLFTGITLTPGGGTWTMDETTLTNGIIDARATGSSSTLCIQEFIG